jgi:hypothetical protein
MSTDTELTVKMILKLKMNKQLQFRIHSFVDLSADLQSLPYVKGEGEMIGGGAGERSLQDDLSQPVPVHNTMG